MTCPELLRDSEIVGSQTHMASPTTLSKVGVNEQVYSCWTCTTSKAHATLAHKSEIFSRKKLLFLWLRHTACLLVVGEVSRVITLPLSARFAAVVTRPVCLSAHRPRRPVQSAARCRASTRLHSDVKSSSYRHCLVDQLPGCFRSDTL